MAQMQMEMVLVDNPEELLTCRQVAQLLGVQVGAINKWAKLGYFPNAWRVNPLAKRADWRIPRKDVDAFFELRRTQRGFFYIPPKSPDTKAE